MRLHERLVNLRKTHGYTQQRVAEALGISRGAYANYEIGTREPDAETLSALAELYGVSVDYLVGRTDNPTPPEDAILQKLGAVPLGKTVKLPVIGVIRAGEPIYAEQNIIDHVEVPEDEVRGGEYFFLQVTGDSMVGAGILPRSRVLVRRQDYVDDGAIAVVLVGEEATIKRVKHVDGKILLIAANPAYEPQVYNEDEVKIIGKVVQTIIKHE